MFFVFFYKIYKILFATVCIFGKSTFWVPRRFWSARSRSLRSALIDF